MATSLSLIQQLDIRVFKNLGILEGKPGKNWKGEYNEEHFSPLMLQAK